MGIFKKVKEILFDVEEPTEQIKITPEMRNEEIPDKEEVKVKVEEPVIKKEVKIEEPKPVENVSERELFKNDSKFPFFDFDEDEFDTQRPVKKEEVVKNPVMEKRSNNVFDYERKKKIEKRTDYGRYEKTEITETIERKKFKPSPIISPVYGILDQDYDKSDILKRNYTDKIDVQEVRNRAFGEHKVDALEKEKPKQTFYEETETVTISEPEEKEKKVKTIDELLEDTSDIVVDVDDDLTSEIDDLDLELNKSEEDSYKKNDTQEMKIPSVDDTLENDLFDLIDSMYDTKDGE